MTRLVPAALAVAVGTFVAASAAVAQQARVALVIGNSAYDTAPLGNPKNDAEDLGRELQNLGFEVVRVTDANKRGMEEAIRSLGGRLNSRSIGLFYYAGHAVQDRLGRNFLIPIGANVKSEADLPYEAVDVSLLLDHLEQAGAKLNIVILDSCRNNPFRSYYRSATSGLAPVNASSSNGTFIIYATQPGNTAADGEGRNSPFAKHLIGSLRQPESYIHRVFARVITGVYEETERRQRPWVSHSLSEDFYFRTADSVPAPAKQALPDALAIEMEFWNSVKEKDARELRAYLEEYPKGRFASLALARLQGQPTSREASKPSQPNSALSEGEEKYVRRAFADALTLILRDHITKPSERLLVDACLSGMVAESKAPVAARYSTAQHFTDDRRRNVDVAEQLFAEVYRSVRTANPAVFSTQYVNRCIRSMVKTLPTDGDEYLGVLEFREFQGQWEPSQAAGIGVVLKTQQGRPAILGVIENSPAERAGLRPGDVFLRIKGGDPTELGLSLQEVVAHLRGPIGSELRVQIARNDEDRMIVLDKTLRRAIIRIDPVQVSMIDKVAYVRLREFSQSSTKALADQLIHAFTGPNAPAKGLVIDLRGNTGGLLATTMDIASAFVPAGTKLIVHRARSEYVGDKEVVANPKNARAEDRDALTALNRLLEGLPVAVLVDGQSAAASEMLAGILKQHRRAVLVGERSAGHNGVRTIMPLQGGQALSLTTTRWYLANGESVRDRGLEPDIRVDQRMLTSQQRGKADLDPTLARAIASFEARR